MSGFLQRLVDDDVRAPAGAVAPKIGSRYGPVPEPASLKTASEPEQRQLSVVLKGDTAPAPLGQTGRQRGERNDGPATDSVLSNGAKPLESAIARQGPTETDIAPATIHLREQSAISTSGPALEATMSPTYRANPAENLAAERAPREDQVNPGNQQRQVREVEPPILDRPAPSVDRIKQPDPDGADSGEVDEPQVIEIMRLDERRPDPERQGELVEHPSQPPRDTAPLLDVDTRPRFTGADDRSAPDVIVTIGQIEVVADSTVRETQSQPRRKARPRRVLPLDEYLSARRGES